MDELHEYLQRKAREFSEMEAILGLNSELNHRQISLLRHAIKHPGFNYTVSSHQTSHGVSVNTSRTDLEELLKRGYLTKSKRANAFIYQAENDLESKLRH